MIIAKVVEPIVTTIKIDDLKNKKILFLKEFDIKTKQVKGSGFWAVDKAQSGIGDIVLVLLDGKSTQKLLKLKKPTLNSIIVGVIDDIFFK